MGATWRHHPHAALPLLLTRRASSASLWLPHHLRLSYVALLELLGFAIDFDLYAEVQGLLNWQLTLCYDWPRVEREKSATKEAMEILHEVAILYVFFLSREFSHFRLQLVDRNLFSIRQCRFL